MNILLTGATGFTGGEVLRQTLARDDIERVLVVTRRPTGQLHPKLDEVLLSDFSDWSSIDLRGIDACIWTLGISQTLARGDEYVAITHGYTLAAAKSLWASNPNARFCFVSGRSADPSEHRREPFARIKGRTEKDLTALAPERAWHFRAGYIRATSESVPRKDAGRFARPIATVLTLFSDDLVIDVNHLARVLLHVA